MKVLNKSPMLRLESKEIFKRLDFQIEFDKLVKCSKKIKANTLVIGINSKPLFNETNMSVLTKIVVTLAVIYRYSPWSIS